MFKLGANSPAKMVQFNYFNYFLLFAPLAFLLGHFKNFCLSCAKVVEHKSYIERDG